MLPKIPYIVYFIALLIIILPSFLIKNKNIYIFIKNLTIWIFILILILLIYQKFVIN